MLSSQAKFVITRKIDQKRFIFVDQSTNVLKQIVGCIYMRNLNAV